MKRQKIKAVVVAGGKGERLRPLTDRIPKPMVDVGGRPILEHTIVLLKLHGISDFIIALCYLPEEITSYFGDGSKFGVKITYTYENPDNPSGTAGAILLAKQYIDSTFIVTYADILRDLNIAGMIEHHKKSNSLATLNVYQHRGSNFKSRLEFNDDFVLNTFEELPTSIELKEGFVWSNSSFYVLEPDIFDFIQDGKAVDFARDVFPQLLSEGKKISVYPSSGYFIDIGTPEKLEEARRTFTASF